MTDVIEKRSEIEEKYKWKLEDIYQNDAAWEDDFQETYSVIEKIKSFSGALSENADKFLHCLKLNDELSDKTLKLYAYARMHRDEDNREEKYQAMTDRAATLLADAGQAVSYISPEIIELGEDKINEYIEELEGLNKYRHFFEDLLRQKEHTLSVEEEKILAASALIAETPSDIYDMWSNADVDFGKIKDENGKERSLTQGNYISFLQNRDRNVRKDAFETLYCKFKSYENTLATTFSGNIKSDDFYAKCRKYSSAIEMALFNDNIDTKVYDSLISTVDKYIYLHKKYLKLRKSIMKCDTLHMYDVYTQLVENEEEEIPYEKACELVLKAFEPLGEEYVAQVKNAFKEGWIDVYETRGKTHGAYSWGCNDTHPYVLLNYQNKINDAFTLAHEMGHAMHSFYTNNTQPTVYKNYRIFVAEVASTVNENLLMEYLLNTTDNKKMRAYLLNHKLEEIRTTVFRQTMFAEFEKNAHSAYENAQSLTANKLCDMYLDLNKKYFYPETIVDKEIAYEWARIPHFYSSFYVYQYATGYSAAVALSDKILSGDIDAVKNYMEFLKSGSSDYPLELLRKAGVDLRTPEPIIKTMESFEFALNEFEKLCK